MTRSTRDNTKVRNKRAEQTGTLVGVRLQPGDLSALDAYATSINGSLTRPQAIRAILADWLRTHGFVHSDSPASEGPATEALKAMDAEIAKHRKSGS